MIYPINLLQPFAFWRVGTFLLATSFYGDCDNNQHKVLYTSNWARTVGLQKHMLVIPSKEFSDIWWIGNNFWDCLTLLLVLTLAWNQMLDKKGWWQQKDISSVCITQQIHAQVKHILPRKRTKLPTHSFPILLTLVFILMYDNL